MTDREKIQVILEEVKSRKPPEYNGFLQEPRFQLKNNFGGNREISPEVLVEFKQIGLAYAAEEDAYFSFLKEKEIEYYELVLDLLKDFGFSQVNKTKKSKVKLKEILFQFGPSDFKPPWSLHRRKYTIEKHISNMIESVKSTKEKQQQLDMELAESAKTDRAILFLLKNGKELGKDFTTADAISTANHLAFGIEVGLEQKQLEESAGYVYFCGEDMCEDCRGWDGISHRCDCGNRRVDWVEGYGFSFENPVIYGEAY